MNIQQKLKKENKTPDEVTTLQDLKKTIGLKLKELDKQFDLSNQLKMTVVDQTYKLMNINYGGAVDQLNPECQDLIPTSTQNSNCDLVGEIINFNHDAMMETLPHNIMVCIYTSFKDTVCQSCCSIQECGSNCDSSCSSVSSNATNMYSIFLYFLICPNTLETQCSDSFSNSQEICQLKEHLQNIVNENQELLFKYKSIVRFKFNR
ncbi:hypothetical protein AGLY_012289 [Aphis glycines]|uniref:Uncharacterized protein n=1 Tax=Aphis glycines TaxID=307491 RepID=A0A6G0TBU9_APHGL|nr:hypothetical protein AGLY_012289 [Aphis glycines]